MAGVEQILRKSRKARGSDNWLTVLYFKKYFGAEFSPKLVKLLMQVSFKSIIEARRVLQNKKHMYPPSLEVLMRRGWNAERIRKYMCKFVCS